MLKRIHRLSRDAQLSPCEYDALRGYSPLLCQRLVEDLQLTSEDRLLDIGCGTGKHTSMVSALAGCYACGVDVDAGRIARARQTNPLVNWDLQDAHDLQFSDGAFTAVQINLAIHRFPDPGQVLREAARVLPRSGGIAITSLSHEQLAERLDLRFFHEALAAELERFPLISQIVQLMRAAGFGEVRTAVHEEPAAPADRDWLDWVQQKPYSAHRLMSDQAFSKNFAQLSRFVGQIGVTQSVVNRCSIVIGLKGRNS